MGLFGKIRDMLTYEDESEDVEPVKKEVSTVSIPAPIEEKEKIDFEVEENKQNIPEIAFVSNDIIVIESYLPKTIK